ncbi:hypothetical protein O181_053776 [Austropuccinia psidii MF-1]|uniref:Secreted protein n=1 Tax=Austropuccinia psidii MF-1 TaxID=1389203 RepID=A0A9Q3HQH7_9BASI|nr:hypothetical protein [Austropuccinia psidii MF-1]
MFSLNLSFPRSAFFLALCSHLFSPSRQVSGVIQLKCDFGFEIPTKSRTTAICTINIGGFVRKHQCAANTCTAPYFPGCFTDPTPKGSLYYPPPHSKPVRDPRIKSFGIGPSWRYFVAYDGVFPANDDPLGQQPPRYMCPRLQFKSPVCGACYQKPDVVEKTDEN